MEFLILLSELDYTINQYHNSKFILEKNILEIKINYINSELKTYLN